MTPERIPNDWMGITGLNTFEKKATEVVLEVTAMALQDLLKV